MADKNIVSIWSYKAETTYVFGPFSDDELEDFDQKIWANTDYNYDSRDYLVLNDPSLFGTGTETSFM